MLEYCQLVVMWNVIIIQDGNCQLDHMRHIQHGSSSSDSDGPSGCSSGFTDEPDPRGAIN